MSNIPIVFLHGFLGDPSDWDPVIAHLDGHPCFPVPLPGHGKTPFTPSIRMPDFPKMHLVGYSMGGRIALQYARANPERIASLTLVSSHLGLVSKEEKAQRWAHDKTWAQKLRTLPFDLFLQKWYAQQVFGDFRPDNREKFHHNKEELAKAFLHYSLAKQERYEPKDARIVVGERDAKYRALFPDAHVIGKAAHMVHLENPFAFAKYFLRVLESMP